MRSNNSSLVHCCWVSPPSLTRLPAFPSPRILSPCYCYNKRIRPFRGLTSYRQASYSLGFPLGLLVFLHSLIVARFFVASKSRSCIVRSLLFWINLDSADSRISVLFQCFFCIDIWTV
ncbi:Schizosaccharomyces pombe specific protein [Schizosaccharomyces pombe]|uniref:Uncharacterized protein C191.03c n=1 Tax=Schizosaccharomyces pombe (strain 972 / ATCC 24843) TaxID=284812 RepID=YQ63_SCHPO|nr:uncharacterized protein SPCC191.03c [Schizosaccharomyces pombe]Q9Y7P7.1 RecName: Full=Uncharacterized protein C191.03c [Schizosaccharomyces pombe 972h-]CAB41049.1 sequence orphan [Schizosaccharomyces pombe]|eukprot:NP_588292.1 uncharacterized protein SPCC191.03c [Schizosaccharomyces pombe]